jgi:hypothetical protein
MKKERVHLFPHSMEQSGKEGLALVSPIVPEGGIQNDSIISD